MKKRILHLLQTLWFWRWGRTLCLLRKGVRLHPGAMLIGSKSCVELDYGVTVGARSRFDTGGNGRIRLEEQVWISTDIEIQTETEVRIGRGTTIQRRCTINGTTRIGDGCIFAPNVFVSSGTHPFRVIPHLPIRVQERQLKSAEKRHETVDNPVWIQDDCWLGTNVVVCPGVTIGKGSVVGANAVVTRDVLPYTVVAGIPAHAIGHRLFWEPPFFIDMNNEEDLVYVLSSHRWHAIERGQRKLIVTPNDSMRVALASKALERGIAVYYHTPHKIEICVGQMTCSVDEGYGVVEFPGRVLTMFHDAAIFQLDLPSSDTQARLFVQKIEVKS